MNGNLKPVLIGCISESVNSSGGVVLNWAYANGENDGSVWPSKSLNWYCEECNLLSSSPLFLPFSLSLFFQLLFHLMVLQLLKWWVYFYTSQYLSMYLVGLPLSLPLSLQSLTLYFVKESELLINVMLYYFSLSLSPLRIIRLTSPNLNYLIVAGCILMSASGLFYSFPTTNYTVVYVLCYVSITSR